MLLANNFEATWQPGAIDLLDVSVNGSDYPEIVEIWRPQGEDHIVNLRHRPLQEIGDRVQALSVMRAVTLTVAVAVTGETHGTCLIERAGDERRNCIVDIGGNAPPFVLLESHGTPKKIAEPLGLQFDLGARGFEIAHLVRQSFRHQSDRG